MIAALNGLEVKSVCTLKTYAQIPVTEKMWTMFSQQFGNDSSKTAVMVRALQGLKSVGTVFRSHIATCMEPMIICLCWANG